MKSIREISKTGSKLFISILLAINNRLSKTDIDTIVKNIKLIRAIVSIPFRTAHAQAKASIIASAIIGVSTINKPAMESHITPKFVAANTIMNKIYNTEIDLPR